MSDHWNEFEDFDFEALMLSKSWTELLPEEKARLEGFVSGEGEYSLMRETLLMVTGSVSSPNEPSLKPGLKEDLMAAYDQQYPRQTVPLSRFRFSDMPRKTWLSMAAAAALFIAVASVWYLVSRSFDTPLATPPQLAANQTDTSEFSSQQKPADEGTENAKEGLEDKEMTGNYEQFMQDDAKGPKTPAFVLAESDTTGAAFYEFSGSTYQAPASVQQNKDLAIAKTEGGKTRSDLSANHEQEDLTLKSQNLADEETVIKQVAIVSQRSRLEKYVPEKKLRTSPRPVSSDPLLLDFLFACP